MDIFVRQDGASLQIKATINVPGHGEVAYTPNLNLGNEHYAGFVVEALRSQLQQQIHDIRQQSYCQGWKDAKAKKSAKKQWFSSVLRLSP